MTDNLRTPWVVEDSDIDLFKGVLEELIEKHPNQTLNILEWGSGGSTYYYTKFLKEKGTNFKWLAIEHDKEWSKKVNDVLEFPIKVGQVFPEQWAFVQWIQQVEKYIRVPFPDVPEYNPKYNYYKYPRHFLDVCEIPGFHLIYIDGRFRSRCVKETPSLRLDTGIVVMDNAERAWYQKAISECPLKNKFIKPHWWRTYNDN